MNRVYVIPLADLHADLETVGGKGASLARLLNAGLPVPDGFHVVTAAYQAFVAANDLQPEINAALQGADPSRLEALEAAASAIQARFLSGAMPQEISSAVAGAYASLPGDRPAVAVRSSATAEDLPDLSFAGQQETFLNVHGLPAVLEAVQRCWASLWTARAIAYRLQHGIDQQAVRLAVVVQILAPAEAAGILFTANPVDGRRDHALINAAWGLGEAVVGGQVTPDTITVDKAAGRVIRRDIAAKQVMTVRSAAGVAEQPVPAAMQTAPALSDAQALQLAELGVQIEQLYGMPMDIEWAWAAGEFSILQARPITALPPDAGALPVEPEWPLPHPKAILARGSFAEFVPEPVTPLFATLAVPIARKASMDLMAGLDLAGDDDYFFTVINNYVYVGFVMTPRMIWSMIKSIFVVGRILKQNSGPVAQAARARCLAAVQKWQAQLLAELAPSQLLAAVREIFATTAGQYTVAQSGPIPMATMDELFFTQLYNRLVKRAGDPEAATFLFGADNQAMRSEKALFDLAGWAQERPALATYLLSTPAETIAAEMQAGAGVAGLDEFAARLAAYLETYGHIVYDLDFAKPLPGEQPAPLLETVKVYLAGRNNPYARQQDALEHRSRAAQAIIKRLDGLRRRWFVRRLEAAQASAPLREDCIAELGLGYPQIRRMLAELGRRLAAGAAIARADDVYWLEAQEADDLAARLERGAALPDLSVLVEQRKARWQAMRRITAPSALPRKSWMARFYPGESSTGDTIKGFGASAGRVTARACVMLGPEDFGRMRPGDIIVAGITTPAWTPLFARAAGIVTDIGGPLGHSSIVAREYGLPAVLGTSMATRRIRTGQIITVDGSAGLVHLSPNGAGDERPAA